MLYMLHYRNKDIKRQIRRIEKVIKGTFGEDIQVYKNERSTIFDFAYKFLKAAVIDIFDNTAV